jgi:hypothetical protein
MKFTFLLICMSCIALGRSYKCGQPKYCSCNNWSYSIMCHGKHITALPNFALSEISRVSMLEISDTKITKLPNLTTWKKLSMITLIGNSLLQCSTIDLLKQNMEELYVVNSDCITPTTSLNNEMEMWENHSICQPCPRVAASIDNIDNIVTGQYNQFTGISFSFLIINLISVCLFHIFNARRRNKNERNDVLLRDWEKDVIPTDIVKSV